MKIKNLIIAYFNSLDIYKKHKTESQYNNALCLVPFEERKWVRAYSGVHGTTETPCCTLPTEWQEISILYDAWGDNGVNMEHAYSLHVFNYGEKLYEAPIWFPDNEGVIKIKENGQLWLSDRGNKRDGSIIEVWWR